MNQVLFAVFSFEDLHTPPFFGPVFESQVVKYGLVRLRTTTQEMMQRDSKKPVSQTVAVDARGQECEQCISKSPEKKQWLQ